MSNFDDKLLLNPLQNVEQNKAKNNAYTLVQHEEIQQLASNTVSYSIGEAKSVPAQLPLKNITNSIKVKKSN